MNLLSRFLIPGLAVPVVIDSVHMWPDYPGLAKSELVFLVLLGVVYFSVAYEVPVLSAFRGAKNDVRTNATRDFLLCFPLAHRHSSSYSRSLAARVLCHFSSPVRSEW